MSATPYRVTVDWAKAPVAARAAKALTGQKLKRALLYISKI
jgi:hypothetical protein